MAATSYSYLALLEEKPEIFIKQVIRNEYLKLTKMGEFNMKKHDVDYLVEKLGCSIFEAEQLIKFDKLVDKGEKDLESLGESAPAATKPVSASKVAPKAKTKKRSAGIQDDELEKMLADIRATFGTDKSFKNKDLAGLLEGWGLTARQTPSRLSRLVQSGLLEDMGGSPKSYKLK